ncbi:FtsX-like permease family protein [Actinoplanes xinjiangensis]|uniref:FtsX-like permease family protein n=1 Tax=Actinoplanes xinjiangensis TaxID=512350 RepID=A0A316FI13_9ACTN|nr:FtsX-like permease family protein [Actinoplanes xinjiangensis]PWK47742.1 FtsX-like permease family protein [Actinoplanes xinjiangensis]GIF39324.1 hypothetical protein Axi01nite_36350 [Actinoplanes xinjiangensis]
MTLTRLAWLVTAGGRGAWGRLAGMAAGIAVGVALLLMLCGAYDGLASRAERSTWTSPNHGVDAGRLTGPATVPPADDVLLVSVVEDTFAGRAITRLDVASSPGSTATVPGIGRPPAIGTYHASPALAALIDGRPADQLGARYGSRAGLIADTALAGPDSLVVVTGTAVADLDPSRSSIGFGGEPYGVWSVTGLRGTAFPSTAYRTVAIIGAMAILLPVLILVGVVTRLGAAERAGRLAALRLIGATPRRVADIAAVEIGVTSFAGAVAGVALAWLLVPVAARVDVADGRFFPADLTAGPVTTVAVVLGVVVVATAVAWWRTARAGIGPLGGSRSRPEHRPSAIGVLPLLVGVMEMVAVTVLAIAGSPLPGTDVLLILGFLLVAFGLLTSGPVLTYWVAGLGAGRSRTAAGVIAMNWIRRHPRATFRSVSGLVAALFMVSVFAAAVTTVRDDRVFAPVGDRIPESALVTNLGTRPGEVARASAEAARVAGTAGVTAAVIGSHHPEEGVVFTAGDAVRLGLTVPDGAGHVRVGNSWFEGGPLDVAATAAVDTTPAILLVTTDGSTASIERARTAVLVSGLRLALPPTTPAERRVSGLQSWADRYAGLAALGIVVATVISAVSLAVSTVAAILDRRRVLGLLRLTGMPVSAIRRVIVAEAALPLATVFALCVGLGFLVAWCILAGLTQGRRSVSWPDPSYYAALGTSLLLAAAAVTATFRTARTNTGLAATRFE